MTPYQRVVAALEAAGSRRAGGLWTCAAHDDHHPSLGVDEAPDGRVLVHCFAGCPTELVVEALGLTMADLFPGGRAQLALFDAERFSPVRRSGWLALPPSSARDFAVATTFGRMLCVDGTFRRAVTGRQVIAVVLRGRSLDALCEALRCSRSHLRNLVGSWRDRRMAHRCDRRTLTLFVAPAGKCPACGADVGTNAALTDGTESETLLSRTEGHGERPSGQRFYAGTDTNPPEGSLEMLSTRGEPRNPTGGPVHEEDPGPHARRVVVTETPEGGRITARLYGGTPGTHRRVIELAAVLAGRTAADADPRPLRVQAYDGQRALELLERDVRASRWPPWGDGEAILEAIAEERRRRRWAA